MEKKIGLHLKNGPDRLMMESKMPMEERGLTKLRIKE